MPFTPSHAAVVLPLLRRARTGGFRGRGPLVAAGLVAGSLAPDVPFFADSVLPGFHDYGRATHSLAGVLTVDPLLAAALVAGWSAVRDPLTALLPPAVRDQALRVFGSTAPVRGGADGVAWFWASAALGAATHIGWDTFTHGGRWGERRFPVLAREVAPGLPLYTAAQYASSAAGLVALGVWGRSAWRTAGAPPAEARADPGPGAARRRTGAAFLTACALAGAVARYRRDRPAGLSGLIASTTFGAGGWLPVGAAALAVAAAGARGRDAGGS